MTQQNLGFDYSGATMSKCGRYRYELSRFWSHAEPLLWIMLNPSTANDVDDDPTIRRCIRFAQREGAGGIIVCNLFALRSTDPAALAKDEDPVGPDNDSSILHGASRAEKIVCAWGVHGTLGNRNLEVMRLLDKDGHKPFCLGFTKERHPRHPLYVKRNAALLPFSVEAFR